VTPVDFLARSRRLLVALDFDGTLAPIVPRAEMAEILPRSGTAIARLSSIPETVVAVVSGRDVLDVRSRLGDLAHVWVAGSHGRVVSPPGNAHVPPVSDPRLDPFRTFPLLSGIRREIKDFSVAFHWRGRDEGEPVGFLSDIRALATGAGLEILEGRMVLEILLPGPGKEGALSELIERTGCADVLFAGDDRTDLGAIRLAQTRGFGIFVVSAERSWMAPQGIATVEGPEHLADWLHRLADLRQDEGPPPGD